MAARVADELADWRVAAARDVELIERLFSPSGAWRNRRREPEGHPVPVGATGRGRAVEIARRVLDDAALRVCPIHEAVKAVEHRFLPDRLARQRRRQLEHRAAA